MPTEMNNQAAQTMPALVDEALTYFAKAGDDGDRRYVEAIRKHIAALSQTAGVADGWKLVPVEPTEAMMEAAMQREDDEPLSSWGKIVPAPHDAIYRAMLAAAPAASGGESGASVSERARAIITETIGYEFGTGSLQPVNDHDMENLAAAIEQALTQQRGECEAVDRDAWAEALELPQGYTVEEFLPGGWHYAWTRADGERMVSGTTWNHPALAAISAWQYAPATTPQPGAEALRELQSACEPFIRHNSSEQFIDLRVPTSAVKRLRGLLESLLARDAE